MISHRTNCAGAPENSLAGIKAGVELGVDRIELDVQRSRDGILVLMHDLKVARFYPEKTYNGRRTSPEGPIKTFPLRGIKESPPYLHDGRLLTLPDAIEFFNLVLGVKLTAGEKKDLLAFLEAL